MNTGISLLIQALFYRSFPLFCCWTFFVSLNFLSYLTANKINLSGIKVHLTFSVLLNLFNPFKGYKNDNMLLHSN